MGKKVWVQEQLPKELHDWEAQARPRVAHPCLLPPEPGRRVFTVIDGAGEGDGQSVGQLRLIPD